jgi:voltage-gated potassium channel
MEETKNNNGSTLWGNTMQPPGKGMKHFDYLLKILIWVSIAAYFIETINGSENSRVGPVFFLWLERFIASVFTIEYFVRWKRNAHHGIFYYPTSTLGMIDLLAIFPFWIGFFVPGEWLRLVRTFRVLRLLKWFRYSRSLQLVALAFYRSLPQLKALAICLLIVGLFSMVTIYEIEHAAQPEAFDGLLSAMWFTAVTVTTVGYGDISPATDAGKIVAMLAFIPSLAIFAGLVGILGNSFSNVLDEESDPNVDPIEEFAKARQRHKETVEINRNFADLP